MSKSKVFIFISIAFAAGVFAASAFSLSHGLQFWLLAIGGGVLLIGLFSNLSRVSIAGLFIACAALGMLRLNASYVPNEFGEMLGAKQQVEGYIVEDPDVRQDKQLLTVRPKGYHQNILVTTTLANHYAYGDWIVVNGKIQEAKIFDDFDYKAYLERFNVYAVVGYPKILVLKDHQGIFFKQGLLSIKHWFIDRLSSFLSEPHRSLLLGILIGAKKSLPQEVVDNFNNTGTSHIIAISGFNITIIISSLAFLAHYLGRRASFWVTLGLIVSFVVLAGASASVIRAAVMGVLLLISFNLGRQYAVAPAMFFAGLIMLLINPRILYWDVGFQLSFVATMGIVYFVPLLEQLTEKWPDFLEIKSTLVVTFAAIAVTLPIILLYFGTLSLSAPLVNILVLPLVPLIMLFGFLTLLPWVGVGFAFADKFLLSYMLSVTSFFAHLPHSVLTVKISAWIAAAMSAALIIAYFLLKWWVGKRAEAVENSPAM